MLAENKLETLDVFTNLGCEGKVYMPVAYYEYAEETVREWANLPDDQEEAAALIAYAAWDALGDQAPELIEDHPTAKDHHTVITYAGVVRVCFYKPHDKYVSKLAQMIEEDKADEEV